MIYFDNGSTTLPKPPEVTEAVAFALNHFGNAGRSFHEPALNASRAVARARAAVARLVGLSNPLNVAFVSSATEGLNLVIGGLIDSNCHVITTVTEHNSVLRPLYLTGCKLSVLDSDENGVINPAVFADAITEDTRFFVCSHGSNLTGNILDVYSFRDICRANGIMMILDASQTMGHTRVNADMADVILFTGHKGLFGPQGTGGIITEKPLDIQIKKTGGAGSDSFSRFQAAVMPDMFEAGTLNAHGIYGLLKGIEFVEKIGIDAIFAHDLGLAHEFVEGVKSIDGFRLYGDFHNKHRLPVVSIAHAYIDASELGEWLWNDYEIATRSGAHCAPLLHKRFRTDKTGLVRFSFSYYNNIEEIRFAINALREISRGAR